MKIKLHFKLGLIVFAILLIPTVVVAQTLNSGNYNLEGSTFDGGGESSSSGNYSSNDSVGAEAESGETNSGNYSAFPGFQPVGYPGVPGQPTLINNGGIQYNALDFIIAPGDGQQDDTVYAIAISDDDFATSSFIQVDGTIGLSEAWQDYAGWGGLSGETVTGLSPNITYKIKVKARYGADSESGYSLTAQAETVGPSLVVAIGGVNSAVTVAGQTTTVSSTSTNIGFGSLTVGDGNPNIAAQSITVTTNATGGYTTTVQQDGQLRTIGGEHIAAVSGTNASPAAFGSGVTTGRFGYHTTDSNLCTGVASRFSTDDTYAALDTVPYEVACNSGPANSEITQIVYKLVVGNLQAAGDYQNVITYITTATY